MNMKIVNEIVELDSVGGQIIEGEAPVIHFTEEEYRALRTVQDIFRQLKTHMGDIRDLEMNWCIPHADLEDAYALIDTLNYGVPVYVNTETPSK